MPRPRTPLLSTERIADAAMELVDAGSPFGVNAIARRLGVTPSSLYNHVSGRDEIIELMRGRLGEQYMPLAIDDDVLEVVAILDAFSIGFGLDLASPDEIWRPETPTTTLGRLVGSSPRGAQRSDRAFESGLEMLLDGLRLRLARTELD